MLIVIMINVTMPNVVILSVVVKRVAMPLKIYLKVKIPKMRFEPIDSYNYRAMLLFCLTIKSSLVYKWL
jgi:hypothetical protein